MPTIPTTLCSLALGARLGMAKNPLLALKVPQVHGVIYYSKYGRSVRNTMNSKVLLPTSILLITSFHLSHSSQSQGSWASCRHVLKWVGWGGGRGGRGGGEERMAATVIYDPSLLKISPSSLEQEAVYNTTSMQIVLFHCLCGQFLRTY